MRESIIFRVGFVVLAVSVAVAWLFESSPMLGGKKIATLNAWDILVLLFISYVAGFIGFAIGDFFDSIRSSRLWTRAQIDVQSRIGALHSRARFRLNASVRLRSGGPTMLVTGLEPKFDELPWYSTRWFTDNGTEREGSFREDQLEEASVA